MKCRLLYVIGQLTTGGSERQLYYLLQALNRARYSPAVVVWNYSENDVYAQKIRALDIPLFPVPNGSKAVKLRGCRDVITSLRPEVVHSYSFFTNLAAWFATVGTSAIPIGAVRSDFVLDRKEIGAVLGRLCARWPRSQIYNSVSAANNACRTRSRFLPRQTRVVRNALDLDRFAHVPLPSIAPVCVQGVGALVAVKRWDRLLAAAAALRRNGRSDFLIRIAGDGPLHATLKRLTDDLGIADCVRLSGCVEDISRVLAEASFLVHTSDAEGCPNSVMEAMACGRPAIATDVGDVSALVVDGVTGFLVPPHDHKLLAERMATLLADRDLCRRMGEAGRTRAERDFSLDRLARETLAAYRAAGWRDSSP